MQGRVRGIALLFGAVIALALTGCASKPAARYKEPTAGLSISVSENGINFWKDVNVDTGVVGGNMRVLAYRKDTSGYFAPKTPEEKLIMEPRFLAGQRLKGATMPLAPRLFAALQQETSLPKAGKAKVTLNADPLESADVQVIPSVLFTLQGNGIVAYESELISRFLDSQGERHKRVYRYIGRIDLPWISDEASWSANDHAMLKAQIDRSFMALSRVLVRDANGDFENERLSPSPKILSKQTGLVTINTVELAKFDDLRVLYDTVRFPAILDYLIVVDDAPANVIFNR